MGKRKPFYELKVLHVQVTEEDIKAGVRGDSHSCPIARAIKRVYPDAFVSVISRDVYMSKGWHAGTFELPKKASEFVRTFDNGTTESEVEPMTFRATRGSF